MVFLLLLSSEPWHGCLRPVEFCVCFMIQLSFEHRHEWLKLARQILPSQLTAQVMERLQHDLDIRVWDDDLSGLDSVIADTNGNGQSDVRSQFVSALYRNVQSVRAFHGCKPIKLDTYVHAGIVPFSAARLRDEFVDAFFDQCGRAVSMDEVEMAISQISTNRRNGVWLSMNRASLIEDGSHLMLFGSEALQGLAAQLLPKRLPHFREVLRSRGTPTILECEVPFASLSSDQASELVGMILETVVCQIRDREFDDPMRDFGFCISHCLPPSAITGVTHPSELYDVFGRCWRRY